MNKYIRINWLWFKYTWEWIILHKHQAYRFIGGLFILYAIRLYHMPYTSTNRIFFIFVLSIGLAYIDYAAETKGAKNKQPLLDFYELSYDNQQNKITLLEHELDKLKDERKYINTLSKPIDEQKLIDEINQMTGE